MMTIGKKSEELVRLLITDDDASPGSHTGPSVKPNPEPTVFSCASFSTSSQNLGESACSENSRLGFWAVRLLNSNANSHRARKDANNHSAVPFLLRCDDGSTGFAERIR